MLAVGIVCHHHLLSFLYQSSLCCCVGAVSSYLFPSTCSYRKAVPDQRKIGENRDRDVIGCCSCTQVKVVASAEKKQQVAQRRAVFAGLAAVAAAAMVPKQAQAEERSGETISRLCASNPTCKYQPLFSVCPQCMLMIIMPCYLQPLTSVWPNLR